MPKDTDLHKAAYKGDLGGCEIALDDDGIAVDALGAQKRTALMRACGAGHVKIVELLLSRGASPTITDASGRSPLHWCAATGKYNIAQILARQTEMDYLSKTTSGTNVIHLIAECGNADFLKFAIQEIEKQGKTLNDIITIQDGSGKTPFELAKDKGSKECADILKLPSDGCCLIL